MVLYEIIETDEGLTVAEMKPGALPEEVALRHGGVVVDPGPYASYDEACDAMQMIEDDEDEDD